MKLIDLFDLLRNKQEIGSKYTFTQPNHKYSIHGVYYKFVIEITKESLWKEIYDKEGEFVTANFVTIQDLFQSDREYEKQCW